MVIKLKEYGKYVIGVGIRESASDLLIQNCDEYYSYNDLAGLTKEVDTPSTQRDPWELAGEAVAQMARNGDVMRSDRLKQVMQQIDPNFDERNADSIGSASSCWRRARRVSCKVTKLDNGQYEVGPGRPPRRPPLCQRSRRAPGERGGGARGNGRDDGRARRGRARAPGRGRERPEGGREAAARSRPRRAPSGRWRAVAGAGLPAHDPGAGRAARAGRPRGVASPDVGNARARRIRCFDPARFPRLLRQANDAEVRGRSEGGRG